MNVFASKIVTLDDLMHVDMEIMRGHLIAKNVAAEVAEKICQSVSAKVIEKTLTTNIRQAMRDTLMMKDKFRLCLLALWE